MSVVWIDGALRDEERARVSVHDRAFTLGDGVFETMRAYGGRVFRLDDHLRRLRHGARRLGIPTPRGLDDAVRDTLAANHLLDAAVRITVSRGRTPSEPEQEAAAHRLPTIVITARPFSPDPRAQADGATAAIATGRLNEHAAAAGLKTIGRVEHVLARLEARRAGADVAILLDTAGHVAEADVANLFAVRGDECLTPPARCGIIRGITRAAVARIAREQGMRARATTLSPADLHEADEAFLTNSLREVVPLVAVGGRAIGRGTAGPTTLRILNAYRVLARAGKDAGAG